MKLKAVLCAMCVGLLASAANATVINFDNLTGSAALASNYAGVNWSSGWMYYDAAQSPYNAASGSERIYNSTSNSSFSFAGDVLFSGAYFSGYQTMAMDFYNDGALVASTGSVTLSSVPTFLASNYAGAVDKVVVRGAPGYFVMDDVTFNAVPEPVSALLVGVGLAGLIGMRRRKV